MKNRRPFETTRQRSTESADESFGLRVLTYNIRGCSGAQRQVDPRKVAEIIGEIDADLIALQEVDAEKPFRKNRNQAAIISEMLDRKYIFFPIEETGLHVFGLAVLSRYPIKQSDSLFLPNLYPGMNPRKRGVMRAVCHTPAGRVHLINTHLSVFSLEREWQLNVVLSWNRLSTTPLRVPIILCGDLNAGPSSLTYYKLSRYLSDVQKSSNRLSKPPQPTYHARSPLFRIDHIFVSDHFTPVHVEVIRNLKTVNSSDHLPLVADLKIKDRTAGL